MITEPTLFILGAGASKPYEFPRGAELRAEIIKDFPNELARRLPDDSRFKHIMKERTVNEASEFIEISLTPPKHQSTNFYLSIPGFQGMERWQSL